MPDKCSIVKYLDKVSIKQASSISKLFEVFDEVVRNYKTTTACLVAIVLQIFSPKVQKNTYSSTI